MNKLQQYLQRASSDLGIKVIIPFELKLSLGRSFSAEALLPQLGASKGMVIAKSYDLLSDFSKELIELGYGYSVYEEPLTNEKYDVTSYMEMFTDWGWTATNEKMPDWMKS